MGSSYYKRTAEYFLLSHNMKRECQCCHNTEWLDGKKIPLEIHHIDGDNRNNSKD